MSTITDAVLTYILATNQLIKALNENQCCITDGGLIQIINNAIDAHNDMARGIKAALEEI